MQPGAVDKNVVTGQRKLERQPGGIITHVDIGSGGQCSTGKQKNAKNGEKSELHRVSMYLIENGVGKDPGIITA
jgi:hypothetical protein